MSTPPPPPPFGSGTPPYQQPGATQQAPVPAALVPAAAARPALAAATAIFDVSDVQSQADKANDLLGESDAMKVGVGLYVVAAGAAVATIFAIIAAVQTRTRPADPAG